MTYGDSAASEPPAVGPLESTQDGHWTMHLAFNTAASFTTNTNWQSYGGENTMSYFSQMVALASHNFFSAAMGIVLAAALVRGISRDRSGTIGNFWRGHGARRICTCCCRCASFTPCSWSPRG